MFQANENSAFEKVNWFKKIAITVLTIIMRSRNIAVSILGFGIPLNIAVNQVFSFRNSGRNGNWYRWLNVAVNSVSCSSTRSILVRNLWRGTASRLMLLNVWIKILFVVSILRLKFFITLIRIKIFIVVIKLGVLVAVRRCCTRIADSTWKFVLFNVRGNVRQRRIHVEIRWFFVRSAVVQKCAVRWRWRTLYCVTLRYLREYENLLKINKFIEN